MAAEPTDTSGVWIRVDMPDEKEKELLVQEYGVPADFISDMADADERPRIEYDDGVTLVVLRIPRKNESGKIPYSTVPLGIVMARDCIITIAPFANDVVADFLQFARKKNVQVATPHDLALRLMTSASVWYMKYMKLINAEVANAENV